MVRRHLWNSGLAALLLALPAGLAAAQDFDSEFDEFDDVPTTTANPSTPAFNTTSGTDNDEFDGGQFDEGQFDGGEFDGGEFEEPAAAEGPEGGVSGVETTPSPSEPAAYVGEAVQNTSPSEQQPRESDPPEFQLHNSFFGPTGGFFAVDARPSRADSFRLQLITKFYTGSDFLVQGDDHEHIGGTLSMSWGLLDWLEIFGSLDSNSNSNNREDPNLIQVIGDIRLGAKIGFPVLPWLALGGDLSLYIPTSAELDPSLSSVGGRLRLNATADFRHYDSEPIPLIARFNIGYDLDNTEELASDIEATRYSNLTDPEDLEDETRHLLTAVERFALGVNRTDFLRIAVGLEAPLEPIDGLVIAPLVEYTVGVPVNRQGFDCPFIPSFPGSSRPLSGEENCLAIRGTGAIPMDLVFGVRVLPPLRGLSALLAVEIGLTGTDPDDQVRELSGNAPWTLYLGAGFAFDVRRDPAPLSRAVTEIDEEGPPPPTARIAGVIIDEESRAPVPGARVHYIASELNDQLPGDDGRFFSAPLEPGSNVIMEITAPDYEPGQCDATVPEEAGDFELSCTLTAVPQLVVVEEGEVVVLEKINFAFDSDEILASSFGLLDSIADTLHQHPDLTHIEVQGHTDDQGSARYNQNLSDRRANAVRRALIERGVESERLSSRGFGLEQPLVPNDSEENRAKNRRVQFIITDRIDGFSTHPDG